MEVLHSKKILFDSYTRDHGLCLKTAIKSRSPSANKKLERFEVSRPPYSRDQPPEGILCLFGSRRLVLQDCRRFVFCLLTHMNEASRRSCKKASFHSSDLLNAVNVSAADTSTTPAVIMRFKALPRFPLAILIALSYSALVVSTAASSSSSFAPSCR